MFWLLLIITYAASVHVYAVYIPFLFEFIEEKMLLYVWGMGNLDLYHTLVEGSDNLWLIIATKNNKKMTTSLNDPQTLWGSFGVTVKQLSIPLLDEELPHSHLIVILRQPNQISYNTSCRYNNTSCWYYSTCNYTLYSHYNSLCGYY